MGARREGFVTVTLTELLLLLLFHFLVALGIVMGERDEANGRLSIQYGVEASVGDLAAQAERVAKILLGPEPQHDQPGAGHSDNALERMRSTLAWLEGAVNSPKAREALKDRPLPEIWDTLVKVQKANEPSKQVRAQLDQINAQNAEIARLREESGRLKKEIVLQEDRISKSTPEIDLLRQEGTQLKRELERYRGRGGNDWAPCWVNSERSAQFVYRINIGEYGLALETTIPDGRTDDWKTVPFPGASRNDSLSLTEFRDTLAPLLK